jgi:hypothetical protein
MESDLRSRLIEAGVETLADTLLTLADHFQEAADAVDRLVATPRDNLVRLKRKLGALRQSAHFYDWRETPGYARELQGLLLDLEAAQPDPRAAVELLATFYRADAAVIECCDDSDGLVGDVFCCDARRMFVDQSRRVKDDPWLSDLLVELLRDDGYDLRSSLVDHASEYLTEPGLEALVGRFWDESQATEEDLEARRFLRTVESLARQLGDPALFERARLATRPELVAFDILAIADVYLDAGDAQTAVGWLQRSDVEYLHLRDQRDRLLLAAYTALGDSTRGAEIAWARFHRSRSQQTLDELLALIGEDERERVVADEARAILEAPRFDIGDAAFLVQQECVDEAAEYVLSRRDQLNGDLYSWLVPIAEILEAKHRPLAATVVYRSLLDSILRRGKPKTYHHGARYLRRLDALMASIDDWSDIPNHATYLTTVRAKHGRKWRFWQEYGG